MFAYVVGSGVHKAPRVGHEGVNKFLSQNPRHVSECMHGRKSWISVGIFMNILWPGFPLIVRVELDSIKSVHSDDLRFL